MIGVLAKTADRMKSWCVIIYLVGITDFNGMYELHDPCTVIMTVMKKMKNMT